MASPVEDQGARKAVAVTKSDTADQGLSGCRGLYIGGAGDVTVILKDDTAAVTFSAVPVGTILPLQVKRLMNATTATLVLALF